MHAEDAQSAPARAASDSPPASTLALRRVAIDTWHENVAYLHRDCAVYRAEGFQALSKVEVRANGRHILATVNVVDDATIVGCDELGLSEDAFNRLGVLDGHTASISQAEVRGRVDEAFAHRPRPTSAVAATVPQFVSSSRARRRSRLSSRWGRRT